MTVGNIPTSLDPPLNHTRLLSVYENHAMTREKLEDTACSKVHVQDVASCNRNTLLKTTDWAKFLLRESDDCCNF